MRKGRDPLGPWVLGWEWEAPVVKAPIFAIQEALVHAAGELLSKDQPLFRVRHPGFQVFIRPLVCGDTQVSGLKKPDRIAPMCSPCC